MGVIDIVIVCCFLPVLYFGIKNGLVKQLVAFAVIYFGITLSLRFATPVAEWITERLQISEFWAKTVSFIFIFFVVALVLSLLGKIVEKIIKISMLGWLNKLLGIAMTFCIFALLISVVALFPILLTQFTQLIGRPMTLSLGGTSLIIVVGVALETVKTLESQMMMRHYKGFLD